MGPPRVSVLTTVYNREPFIGEAIESVLASSFQDFEYIIVDDCSTDRSYEVASRYATADRRISVYRNDENIGDYPNRNKAASLARGEFIKYVDSDDILYPHGLKVMVDAMSRFCGAGFAFERPPAVDAPYPLELSAREAYAEQFFGGGLFDECPTASIIRRTSFEAVGGFSEVRYSGDTDLWLRLASLFSVVKLPKGLVWWRNHGEQEFHFGQRARDGYIVSTFNILATALSSSNCPLRLEERTAALRHLKRRQLKAAGSALLKQKDFGAARNVLFRSRVGGKSLAAAFFTAA